MTDSSYSSLDVYSAEFTEMAELLEAYNELKIELRDTKKAHRTVLNNLKAVAYKESIDFLKQKSKVVSRVLTNSHRKIVR